MELPEKCAYCGALAGVDWDKPERRFAEDMLAEGFTCHECGNWNPLFYLTRQFDEKLKRFEAMPPRHSSFQYYFAKTRNRALEMQKRGRNKNGAI